MVLISVGIAGALGIALGVLLTRRAGLRRWVLGFAGLMQTVPSLALFGFLIPIPLIGGIGRRTAILALVLYALLPVLRNTLAGILGVDRAVRESAVAMGMTERQILWEVELPSGVSHHPGGNSRRDRHHHRYRHHRRLHRRGRTWRADLPRAGVGRFVSDSGGSHSRGLYRAARGRGIGMGRTQIVASVIARLLLASCGGSGRIVVGSKNFTVAAHPGRNSGAAPGAASGREGGSQTQSGRNAAGSPGSGRRTNRSVSGVHGHGADGGAEASNFSRRRGCGVACARNIARDGISMCRRSASTTRLQW